MKTAKQPAQKDDEKPEHFMTVDQLLEDREVAAFIKKIKAESTKKTYLQGLQLYTDYHQMTPKDLIKEAEDEEEDRVRMHRRKINDRLLDFIKKCLEVSDLSDNTRASRLVAVKSFYKKCGIERPEDIELKRTGDIAKEENMAIPTKDDIIDVLKHAKMREKAIILVGISSGLSANEIRNLKIKDFNKGYDPESEITTLDLRREKTNVRFQTYLSPEASRAVQEYIADRKKPAKTKTTTERIQQREKQHITSDDNYLFILKNVPDRYLEEHDDELRKISENALFKMYANLSEEAQKDTPDGSWNIIRSHNMRKIFNSSLLNAGADSQKVEYWMGHKVEKTKAAYNRTNPEQVRNIYEKYIPYLTIQKESVDLKDNPTYQKVAEENKALAAALAVAKVENDELKDLRAEMEARKEFENMFAAEVERMKSEMDRWNIIKDRDPAMDDTIEDTLLRYKYDPEFRAKHFKKGEKVVEEKERTEEDIKKAYDYGEDRE